MNWDLFREIVIGILPLLCLPAVYALSTELSSHFRVSRLVRALIDGFLAGAAGAAALLAGPVSAQAPVPAAGIWLSAAAAYLSGPAAAAAVCAAVILARLPLGGPGALYAIPAVLACAACGLLWRRALRGRGGWPALLLLGAAVQGAAFAAALPLGAPALPRFLWRAAFGTAAVAAACRLVRAPEAGERPCYAALESIYQMFEENAVPLLLVNPENDRIEQANRAAQEFYGRGKEEITGRGFHEFNRQEGHELEEACRLVHAGKISALRTTAADVNGTLTEVEIDTGLLRVEGRELVYAAVHDISGRLREEAMLREQDHTLRQLIDSAPLTIYIQSEGRIAYINQAGVRLFGASSAEELQGTPVVEHVLPEYREFVEERIRNNNRDKAEVPPAEEIYRRQDGTSLYVEVEALPTSYMEKDSAVVFVRDLTARREAEGKRLKVEAQIRQQQKLEAIGTLAGGVAHEINNPLNGIMNYAQLILDECAAQRREPEEESTIAEYGNEIIRETQRISEIVRSLLQFSRQEKQSHSYASLYDIVNQTMMLIKTVVKRDQIQLDIRLDDNLPPVKCRSQQIQQVLMNLMTNARDALNEKYPGYDENKRIAVRCSAFEYAERRWIRLTVEDTGPGIAPAVQEKMFEPFFSTKPKELGTGLGLAISHGIVKDHHGRIEVETQMGRYTRFMVVLPVDNGWDLNEYKESEAGRQPEENRRAEEPDEQGTDR